MPNFLNIEYLKSGNEKQQTAYKELKDLKLFENLKEYGPLLTGTVPVEIDLPNSDLDIICQCKDHNDFVLHVSSLYGNMPEFVTNQKLVRGITSSIIKFKGNHFIIEIFAQDLPATEQYAYRHMIIEHQILQQKDEAFKLKILSLKRNGFTTEQAFAKLLNLPGDPYEALFLYQF